MIWGTSNKKQFTDRSDSSYGDVKQHARSKTGSEIGITPWMYENK